MTDRHRRSFPRYWQEEFDRRSRVAVILPTAASTLKGALFYETACQNRGWNARVFPDRQSAMDWLARDRSAA